VSRVFLSVLYPVYMDLRRPIQIKNAWTKWTKKRKTLLLTLFNIRSKGQRSRLWITKCKNILKAIEWPAWVMYSLECRELCIRSKLSNRFYLRIGLSDGRHRRHVVFHRNTLNCDTTDELCCLFWVRQVFWSDNSGKWFSMTKLSWQYNIIWGSFVDHILTRFRDCLQLVIITRSFNQC